MTIPQEQVDALSASASSGDATAKDWLSELGHEPTPATSGDAKKDANGATEGAEVKAAEKPKGEVSPQGDADATAKALDGVDARRDGAGGGGNKPNIYTEVKRLRQERRELRAEREESRKREDAMNSRLAQLETMLKSQPHGDKPQPTEEDDLTKLLTKPGEYLAERDKKLISMVRDALKADMAQARATEERREQKSSAIKILESIQNFSLDEHEDEVFQLMEEEYGWDEADVEHELATRPTKAANLIKRAWEKKHSLALSPEVKAAKSSAGASANAGGGSTHSKTTHGDINARAKMAKSPEELEKLWGELEKL